MLVAIARGDCDESRAVFMANAGTRGFALYDWPTSGFAGDVAGHTFDSDNPSTGAHIPIHM
jgi:hypothetical protein